MSYIQPPTTPFFKVGTGIDEPILTCSEKHALVVDSKFDISYKDYCTYDKECNKQIEGVCFECVLCKFFKSVDVPSKMRRSQIAKKIREQV